MDTLRHLNDSVQNLLHELQDIEESDSPEAVVLVIHRSHLRLSNWWTILQQSSSALQDSTDSIRAIVRAFIQVQDAIDQLTHLLDDQSSDLTVALRDLDTSVVLLTSFTKIPILVNEFLVVKDDAPIELLFKRLSSGRSPSVTLPDLNNSSHQPISDTESEETDSDTGVSDDGASVDREPNIMSFEISKLNERVRSKLSEHSDDIGATDQDPDGFDQFWDNVELTEDPRVQDIRSLFWDNMERLVRAMARIIDDSVQPSFTTIFLRLYSILLQAAIKHNAVPQFVDFLTLILSNMPKASPYCDLCGWHEQFNLSQHVFQLASEIVNLALKQLDYVVTIEPDGLKAPEYQITLSAGTDFAELNDYRREVDKACLRVIISLSLGHEGDRNQSNTSSILNENRTVVFDAPLRLLSKHFRGREKTLFDIIDALYTDYGARAGHCILYSKNSSGKTQTILALLKIMYHALPDVGVFWVTASSVDNLHRSCETILSLCGKGLLCSDRRQRMLAVRQCLTEVSQRGHRSWLLVVDDLHESVVAELREMLPIEQSLGRIIYTTKNQKIKTKLLQDYDMVIRLIDLPLPDKMDAADILLASADLPLTSKTRQWASAVAESLGCRPVLVKHVGALLKRNMVGEGEITRMSDDKWDLPSPLPTNSDAEDQISIVVWRWIFSIVKRNRRVYRLLCVLALFDPESIPLGPLIGEAFAEESDIARVSVDFSESALEQEEISSMSYDTSLTDSAVPITSVAYGPLQDSQFTGDHLSLDEELSWIFENLSNRATRATLLKPLLGIGILGKRSNFAQLTLRMHLTVQQVLREDISPVSMKTHFSLAVALAAQAMDKIRYDVNELQSWRRYAIMVPHINALTKLDQEYDYKDRKLAMLYSRIGDYFHASGEYAKATNCYMWCKQVTRSSNDISNDEKIARTLIAQEKLSEAEDMFRRVLKPNSDGLITLNLDKLSYEEGLDKLSCAEGLALCWYSSGYLLWAEALYTQIHTAMDQPTDQLGVNNRSDLFMLTKIKEGLANTYQRLGRPDPAKTLYRECFAYLETQKPPKPLIMLRLRHNQARVERDSGNLPMAQTLFESILEEYKQTVGLMHPDALLVAVQLADIYAICGDYPRAEQLGRETLGRHLLRNDPSRVDLCYTQWVLGVIYTHMDQESTLRAQSHFLDARAGFNKELKKNHPFSLSLLRDYSHMFQIHGQLVEAVQLLRELPAEVRRGSVVNAKLARLLDWQSVDNKDFQLARALSTEATNLAQETLAFQEDRLGPTHPDTNYTRWVLARIFRRSGDRNAAADHYAKATSGFQPISGQTYGGSKALQLEYESFKRGEPLPGAVKPAVGTHGAFLSPDTPMRMIGVHVDWYQPQVELTDAVQSMSRIQRDISEEHIRPKFHDQPLFSRQQLTSF